MNGFPLTTFKIKMLGSLTKIFKPSIMNYKILSINENTHTYNVVYKYILNILASNKVFNISTKKMIGMQYIIIT